MNLSSNFHSQKKGEIARTEIGNPFPLPQNIAGITRDDQRAAREKLKTQKVKFGSRFFEMDQLGMLVELPVNYLDMHFRHGKIGFAQTIYKYENGVYAPNVRNLETLQKLSDEEGITILVHLPDIKRDNVLTPLMADATERYIDRLRFFNQLFLDYGVGELVSFHPPIVAANGEVFADSTSAVIKAGRKFFEILNKTMHDENWKIKIAVETAGPATTPMQFCTPLQLVAMLTGLNENIGILADAAHLQLIPLQLSTLLMLTEKNKIPIMALHFSGNNGINQKEQYWGDEHEFPSAKNVLGFEQYLDVANARLSNGGLPVIVELARSELLRALSEKGIGNFAKDMDGLMRTIYRRKGSPRSVRDLVDNLITCSVALRAQSDPAP